MIRFYPHFIAWFVAVLIFGWVELAHPGFVSYVFPFPVLIVIPIILAALTMK